MDDRLTPDQFQKLIAEVERLQQQRQAELSQAQVEEILQELHLPPELLPEALIQLKRREALAAQKQRRIWFGAGAIAAIALIILAIWGWSQYQQQRLNRVMAQADQITLSSTQQVVTSVTRPAALLYQVTLQQAPVGQQLPLRCDWQDPSGLVVHQNQYATKPITTAVWTTHCRYTLPPNAAVGTWTVQMFQGDRPLSDQAFEVR